MALGLKLSGSPARVFTVLGDGELPEGSNWEAFAAAAHHKVDNLTAFIDVNGLQISGATKDVMNLEPIDDKVRSFGWEVRTIDGNDMEEILDVLDALPLHPGRPTAVVARTVKSKGLSFAEGVPAYHYWKPKPDALAEAEAEIRAAIGELERAA
jgi:transketolase